MTVFNGYVGESIYGKNTVDLEQIVIKSFSMVFISIGFAEESSKNS